MKTMIEYVHQSLVNHKVDIAIDFTMGNGYDTVFLSTIAKVVYSFDIQPLALEKTTKMIHKEHVHLVLDSHENFDHYVENFDIGIFNLGYLPNGDHSITTTASVTLRTLSKALDKLNHQGTIFIVVYIGHPAGKKESEEIESYVKQLSHRDYNVASFRMLNKQNAPYVIEIEKR